ncbi:hypothetical protein NE237_006130 [Protea cynaroides]|uniref:Uncharacterized protein n=1 Tax=Protea cynaroides TaxID=273540 RepID=A0A9Q0KLZ2_9MAGN|nr:hypothetical protein NE237_006130 [Protea cynaroides]
MGRRAETIILPLELIGHLKPSELNDSYEYQIWQKRQFKILEASLLLYPSIPLEQSKSFAIRLQDIVRGFPLNIHLYLSLIHSFFDHKDETVVLNEIDELLELMKKTWSTLRINKLIHSVCFTWILFQQYVAAAQAEPDLLTASPTMMAEVANDAKKANRDPVYLKILSSVLTSM